MKNKEILNFCTLFESNYFSRGLALYESLLKTCHDFHLYVFAFNDESLGLLKQMNLEKATIVSLNEFENEDLLRVKQERSVGEYCWTCTSSSIKYCLETFSLEHCIYLDADLYFFSSPQVLVDEAKDSSVIITEHRYTEKYDQSAVSGKYCVQFMYFKNNKEGLACLNWWIDACIEWCFAIPEEGKFGDQKYLDDWTTKFEGVHELQHLGGGAAPWNIQQYDVYLDGSKLMGREKASGNEFQFVFYHFHDIKLYLSQTVDLGDYILDEQDLELIYKPYLQHLLSLTDKVHKYSKAINLHGIKEAPSSIKHRLKGVKRRLEKNYNILPITRFV